MPLLQRYIVPLWKTTPLPRMISKARRFPLLPSHLLYSLVSSSFSPLFQSFRITDEGGRISSLSLFFFSTSQPREWKKKSPDWKLISGLYRGCCDTPLVVIISYISPRRRSTRPFEKLPPAFYGTIPEIEVWDTRLANPLARVLGLENKRSIESLETVAPYYIFLPTILPMTLLGRGEGAVEERQKFLLAPIRPSTNLSFPFRFFFLFSFFIRIFRFEDSKRGCKRATRDSEQRGIRPLRIELINRISREDIDCLSRPITKGIPLRICFLCFLPFISRFLSFRPFELTTDSNSRGILVVVIDAPLKIF